VSTAQTTRFAGLRALAAKIGSSVSGAALTAGQPGASEEPLDPADGPAPEDDDDAAAGTGAGEGEGNEGEGNAPDDSEAGNAGAGAGEGDDPAPGGAGEPAGGGTDASYNRGYAAASGRWAATFLNESCRANLELATDLLADTNMTPDKIAAYCSRNAGGSSASTGQQRLATTPKPKVGVEGGGINGGTPGEQDEGQVARKAATAHVNTGAKRRAAAAGVATRRAGGPKPGNITADAAGAGK
jgi:hypothetical protein